MSTFGLSSACMSPEYDLVFTVTLFCVCRCLWFMLEVLMTKNENNSHAFLRKMVENIKQTKDAQCPDDTKANEVHTHNFGWVFKVLVTDIL